MPLKLDIVKTLNSRSDRVKSVDFHPSEPWLLVALYNGQVNIWNHEQQLLLKTFEICDLPSRCGRFVARKSWFIVGSDDMQLRVYNYNTHERVAQFEGHQDYIRAIAVHPSQSLFLSCGDDMQIKLWGWDRQFKCVMQFEGHTHYVMSVQFNPKDSNTFASASLDRTIKVWQLGASHANYTLEGHEKGVNYVEYYHGAEKPYLISSADDKNVKIWDYQNKSCVQTLEGHTANVSAACFHPELPVILTAGEDSTVRIWHATTYRLENTLNYGFERVWAIGYQKNGNNVAFGCDEGTVCIQLGREDPAVSMDSSGKIVYAKHNQIQSINVQPSDYASAKDGERIVSAVKDLGNSEVYPQTLQHSPNGRFAVVCGDGEYIIYTALSWRNKSFGQALEFVWSSDSNEYAVRETASKIKLFKQFKERIVLNVPFSIEQVFGGALLAARSKNYVCFYDWNSGAMVRRIDEVPKNIWWSENGELVCISCAENYYVLRFNAAAVNDALSSGNTLPEEGVVASFDSISSVQESVKNGCWVGDCFIYTTTNNKLNYLVGGQVNTIAHFDKPMFLLGYLAKDSKVLICDKDIRISTYSLSIIVLEYQVAILRKDFRTAESLLPQFTPEQRNKVARFLEASGYKETAMQVTSDPDHKFELALSLRLLDEAYSLAQSANNEMKWKQVGDFALQEWNYSIAEECLLNANDLSGLFLIYHCTGNAQGLKHVAQLASESGAKNLSFLTSFAIGDTDSCLKLLRSVDDKKNARLPEAALFAKTYAPSLLPEIAFTWKSTLEKEPGMKKIAQALADPVANEEMFGDLPSARQLEQSLKQGSAQGSLQPAARSPSPVIRQPIPEVTRQQSAPRSPSPVRQETASAYSMDVNTAGSSVGQMPSSQGSPVLSKVAPQSVNSTSPVQRSAQQSPKQQKQPDLLDLDDLDAVLNEPAVPASPSHHKTGDDELDELLNF